MMNTRLILLLILLCPWLNSAWPQFVVINEVMPSNHNTIEDGDGDTPDWIEIFNAGTATVDMAGFGLSDDSSDYFKWVFPSVHLGPQEFMIIFASGKNRDDSLELHSNFKISASGETLVLADPTGTYLDFLETGQLPSDVSKGRYPDGSSTWKYFTDATPGQQNNTQAWPGVTSRVEFSTPPGFYESSLLISLETEDPDDVIRYTVNGDEPTNLSTLFEQPILVTLTKVIRAKAFHPGFIPSSSTTATYFIDAEHDLPVFSLSTNPDYLFDPYIGIYHDNNIWQDWERPVHVEFFDSDDSSGFSIDGGIKLYGAWTRTFAQKSLKILAREEYGYNEVDYPLFPDLPLEEFESFILRNSGNDWQVTMFRDGLMTGLVAGDGVDVAAFRPAAVYINGDYWGFYNMRESLGDRYIEAHHGVPHDSLDLLELNAHPVNGDSLHYAGMIEFITNNPVSYQPNYNYVKSIMDVDEFMTYEIAEIFYCNTDWPGNNIKFWRHDTSGGQWRWMLYDTDFGFGLVEDYMHNTLDYATDPNSSQWSNPPWSTFLLRQLLTNQEFRFGFINRYADLLNSSFATDHMLAAIDERKNAILSEMPGQIYRWGGNMWDWLSNVQVLRNFALGRRFYAQSHVVQHFDLSGSSTVTLNVDPPGAGHLQVSTLHLKEFPWTGEYFRDVPVQFSAFTNPGYQFSGWQGDVETDSATFTHVFTQDATFIAVFESYIPDTVVINEINYNSSLDFNTEDWMELYNPMEYPVNLAGWEFRDEEDIHGFVFPAGTVLPPDGYLVLCADTNAFRSLFPEVTNFIGNFLFGLSGGGELLRLYDFSGLLIDTVHYDDVFPWPPDADGLGPTLELIDPDLDNALPESWMASAQHGTPGWENGLYTGLIDPGEGRSHEVEVSPNPFRDWVSFTITAEDDLPVVLHIFDIMGNLTLKEQYPAKQGDKLVLNWEGRDEHGRAVQPGVYFCNILAGRDCITFKLIRIQ